MRWYTTKTIYGCINLNNSSLKENALFHLLVLLVILIFSFVLFGLTGVRVVFGIVLVSLPFYLLLALFNLSEGEKAVFSILMGLTIFSSLVYLLGLFISFRTGIFVLHNSTTSSGLSSQTSPYFLCLLRRSTSSMS